MALEMTKVKRGFSSIVLMYKELCTTGCMSVTGPESNMEGI